MRCIFVVASLSSSFSSSSPLKWYGVICVYLRKIKYEGPNCLFMFFFYFSFCIVTTNIVNWPFIYTDYYLYVFLLFLFSICLIALCFGVILSSKINDCLKDIIGYNGGAHFGFYDGGSWFRCNGEDSGDFLKGLQLNCVIRFFIYLFILFYFIFFCLLFLSGFY
jgi:hypothetical protein